MNLPPDPSRKIHPGIPTWKFEHQLSDLVLPSFIDPSCVRGDASVKTLPRNLMIVLKPCREIDFCNRITGEPSFGFARRFLQALVKFGAAEFTGGVVTTCNQNVSVGSPRSGCRIVKSSRCRYSDAASRVLVILRSILCDEESAENAGLRLTNQVWCTLIS